MLWVGFWPNGEMDGAINKNSKSIENNAEFSAWTMAARILLNLDETITRE